ncbi:hypothetical protein IMAU30132_00397 [Lactobacillus helveticus]|nr:hypothetical protein [Lactobacillus helveticus]NRO81629.1 hypothetical protein [Lactobacillus helveticus]
MRIHIFKGGHTLSAGQTGNIIFFSFSLANHNIPGMINRASTFIVGLLVVGLFHKYVKAIIGEYFVYFKF